ncbi:MAG: Rossmann-like and DUF2520 domain-containing protein [Sphingobacterium composti]|uniref:Rossmann-like and DUF2520 domain-containing protein n=1 Tax=Sphingobacterium composti TaxID=363260 RepID=UPI00135BB008|nr:DUF2520 domain-containing protein [Sphingobacterium composti Ten et al. 2007 non Yoo et al. 2007]
MKIVVLGSGNIATHLAKALYASQHNISQIYSRTLANAQALANVVNSQATTELRAINIDADLYIIAVSDSAISSIATELPKPNHGIVIHTSGATQMEVLSKFDKYGVIYPPQSINKEIETNLSLIPFGIEGNNAEVFNVLFTVVQNIAPKSFACTSKQRLTLHLSAVIANNFSNALYQVAEELLAKENLDFELLKPIILETALKVQDHSPTITQTGPARRGDYNTINKHLEFLIQSPEQHKIYQILTDFIIKRYRN